MVTALAVSPDDVRLLRLLQLYVHEWSGRIPVAIGADGLFPYADLAHGHGDDREPVLFVDAGLPVGFALVARDALDTWHVEEFFVIVGARRRGTGAAALAALLARHPGTWTLTVRPENPEGLAFWTRVLAVAPIGETGDDGVVRQRFTFVR